MMLTVETARERVLAAVQHGACGVERVMLDDALGRTLAERLLSAHDWPPFSHSAMDGVAGRFIDLQTPNAPLRVIGIIPAGLTPHNPISPGEVMRIMTGAMLPPGADTVVMREHIQSVVATDTADGEHILITQAPKKLGAYIRRQGEDVRTGDVLAEVGITIDAGLIGVLASQGRSQVAVQRKPRVAIVTTGDELVEVDHRVGPGQLVNSTSYTLAALVRDAGGVPWVLPRVPDNLEATVAALRLALKGADLVLTVGGVSVGDRDYVKAAMAQVGVGLATDQGFWRVAMRPGKPLAFGTVDGVPVLGLPGNPVSSYVTFMLFARPAIWKMRGVGGEAGAAVTAGGVRVLATLEGHAVAALPDREEYARGWLRVKGARLVFTPCTGQASGNLLSVATTNGLAVVAMGRRVEVDDAIQVLLVGPLSP